MDKNNEQKLRDLFLKLISKVDDDEVGNDLKIILDIIVKENSVDNFFSFINRLSSGIASLETIKTFKDVEIIILDSTSAASIIKAKFELIRSIINSFKIKLLEQRKRKTTDLKFIPAKQCIDDYKKEGKLNINAKSLIVRKRKKGEMNGKFL